MAISETEFLQVKSHIHKSRFVNKNYLVPKGDNEYLKYRVLRPYLKLKYKLFQTMNPGMPWISPDAIKALKLLIKPEMTGFEYGSGSSTIFLSKLFNQLHSVEHDESWHKTVLILLQGKKIGNTKVNLVTPDQDFQQPNISSQQQLIMTKEDYPIKDEAFLDYVRQIEAFDNQSLDFVSVDGRARVSCAHVAIPKLKRGGLLMLDNSERARYTQIHETLSDWDYIYTTTGLTDTIIWRKP